MSDKLKVITQENHGLGHARNRGLEIAKGEYMCFLDGDDWLAKEAFEKLYKEVKDKNTETTMFQIIKYNDKTKKFDKNDWFNLDKFDSSFENCVFSSDRTKDFLFHISISACQKIFKRSYLESINAKFPEGIFLEDNVFAYYVWLKASRISIVKNYLYYRRSHENSITFKCDKKFYDIIPSGKKLFKIFIDNGWYEIYKKELINYTINAYRLTINTLDDDLVEKFYEKSKIEFENISNSEYIVDFLKYMSTSNKKILENILESDNLEEFKKLNTNPKGRFKR